MFICSWVNFDLKATLHWFRRVARDGESFGISLGGSRSATIGSYVCSSIGWNHHDGRRGDASQSWGVRSRRRGIIRSLYDQARLYFNMSDAQVPSIKKSSAVIPPGNILIIVLLPEFPWEHFPTPFPRNPRFHHGVPMSLFNIAPPGHAIKKSTTHFNGCCKPN
jgi:hypothetical protein